jgi:hypothetical protein
VGLSEYEQRELNKVHEHKERILSRSPKRLVPATVQERGTELYTKLKVPGVNKAKDSGAAVLGATASGAGLFQLGKRNGRRGRDNSAKGVGATLTHP